jgi:hypothetical protein
MHQFVDRPAKGARIAEQRGDVAKQDAGLRDNPEWCGSI